MTGGPGNGGKVAATRPSTSAPPAAVLTVFVPGPLRNPMNGSHGHWSKHARWAREWRERTHAQLWVVVLQGWPLPEEMATWKPKRITFMAHTARRWDDDNLRAGMKPMRDALKDAGLIDDDGPKSGHEFIYQQVIDRHHRGVEITVEPRP
jgi:hypothetical protein